MEITQEDHTSSKTGTQSENLLFNVSGLTKHFEVRAGLMSKPEILRAVNGLDFSVHKNKVFSIVGESGCGKSTVARLLLKLTEPTSGKIEYRGEDINTLRGQRRQAFRRAVQIIFQDPFASLNPRRTVYETVSEPIKIHKLAKRSERKEKVAELLAQVGLHDVMNRYPHEFSGGQRQRVCIARALAVSPEIIIADEPLSALDVSIQAQIMNLMIELKEKSGLSYIFISHDLNVVRYLSDEVAVMYLGNIVEHTRAEELFQNPLHPYTEILLKAATSLTPGRIRTATLKGEVPSPFDIPTGCAFHPRCPRSMEVCSSETPELINYQGRQIACHLWK